MPAMVFEDNGEGCRTTACVDDNGVTTVTSTSSEGTLVAVLGPSGTVALAFDGIPAQEADDGFVLPDGRTVARYCREQRCGGSDKSLADIHGNIIFSEAKWLGAMCAGTKIKAADGTILTDCFEKYVREEDALLILRTVTLPDGRTVESEERKPVPPEN